MSIKVVEFFLDDTVNVNDVLHTIKSSFLVKDTDRTNVFWVSKNQNTNYSLTILKPKEIAVLNALEKGQSYKEIAVDLKFSINAVRFYVKKIYTKLEVTNSRMAVLRYSEIKNNLRLN